MSRFRQRLIGLARRLLLPVTPPPLRLSLGYRLAGWEGSLEPELIHLDSFAGRGTCAIDVGANAGHYSYRLARRFSRVIAFEPNAALTRDLAAWNPGHVEIRHEALSSAPGTATLQLPWLGGRALGGWASLETGNCPVAERYTPLTVPTLPLDGLHLTKLDFLKIDVEGHELALLRGAGDTIARCRPRVLIEVRAAHEAAVNGFFASHGYVRRRLTDYAAVVSSPENLIFDPGSA